MQAVPARVLDHRLQDPLRKVCVDADAERLLRQRHFERNLPLLCEAHACRGGAFGNCGRVCCRPFSPGLVPRRGDERVDDPRQLACARVDQLERVAVLVRISLATKRNLGLGKDPRERRAQLMRELGREEPLVPQARGQAVEQAVERRGKLRELVVRRTKRKAMVEIALAPSRRLPRHSHDRPQRRGKQPARSKRDKHERDGAENKRRTKRGRTRLLVRGERHTRDNGSRTPTAHDDRRGIEPRVGVAHVDEVRRCAGQAQSGPLKPGCRSRPLEDPRAGEDPQVGVCAPAVRDAARLQLAVLEAQRRDLGRCAGPRKVAGVPVECVVEDEIEHREQRSEHDGHRRNDDDEQAAPQTEPAHAMR